MNNRIILLTTVMSAAFVISPDIAQGSRKAAMQKDILKQQGVEVQTGEQADYILKQNKVEEAKTAISGGVTPEQYVTDSKAGVAIGNIIIGSVTQRI